MRVPGRAAQALRRGSIGPGVDLEIRANDDFSQSNTYYLDHRGMPAITYSVRTRRRRPSSTRRGL